LVERDYVFNELKNKKSVEKFTDFLRYQTTAEYGGNQIFDGTRSHLLHNPEELAEFVYVLTNYQKKYKFQKYLEVGYSTGITNTILNKFFNFKQIVAVDNFSADISSTSLLANLRRKNLSLICGNSDSKRILNIVKEFGKFDLIFIDGSHEYENVKKDLENYSKLLSNNGILAVHDIHSLEHPGVNKAWNEFKKKNKFSYKEIVNKNYYFVCGVGLAFN
jgi:predicted O-methyltransferase YrrM